MIPILAGALKPVLGIVDTVLDRVLPDPEQKAAAKRAMIELQLQGELQGAETQLSAILAEAQSDDPWTSRARPSFLYVMYLMILAAIPFGVLSAFHPEMANAISAGSGAWLRAIPGELYQMFGLGYLGYSGARSIDKWRGRKAEYAK